MTAGPAISFRSLNGKYVGVYALPGDQRWRTVGANGKDSLFDTAREAEAIAGHVLCAKIHQSPAVLQEPHRQELHALLNDLVDWHAMMGGFEAPVWGRVEKMRERVAAPPARPRLVAGGR
jgi:hypothetical protein